MEKVFCLILLISCCSYSKAEPVKGFGLNATRVIYLESDSSKSVTARNNTSEPLLVISKIIDNKGDSVAGWISPQVSKIDKESKLPLRIILNKNIIKKDEESLFFLSATAIKASENTDSVINKVPIAVGVKIKILYRPAALSGNANEAAENLVVKGDDKSIVMQNNSSYHVNLDYLIADKNPIHLSEENSIIKPKSRVILDVPKKYKKIDWIYINDLGGRVLVENK